MHLSVISADGENGFPPARERTKRWLGHAPIRVDGDHVELDLVPAALVADVARDGMIGPQTIAGVKRH